MKPLRSRTVEHSTLSSSLRILAAADGDTAILDQFAARRNADACVGQRTGLGHAR
ncbi:MAG: hypothetical protein ABIG36_22770 [Pseudomonadota bacterium]